MLWPWIRTSATRPSSTACMKRVKVISGARGCCLLTIDQRIRPIRRSSSQSPRLRETGFKDTSMDGGETYHVDFPWAMHAPLAGSAVPAGTLEDAADDQPGPRPDRRSGRSRHPWHPEDLAGQL